MSDPTGTNEDPQPGAADTPAADTPPAAANEVPRPLRTRATDSARVMGQQVRGIGTTSLNLSLRYVPWILTIGLVIWIFGLFDLGVRSAQNLIWYVRRPTAMIFVESPEVYTRERLINERLAEETWLNEQLPTDEDVTGQASSYLRFLDRTSLGAQPPSDETGEDPAPANGVEVSPPLPPAPAPAGPPGEAFPMAFDQRFQLLSAYRSLIRQRIIENRLDDRHDLEGNALYILKFDTTVAGVPRYGERAIVTVRVSPPPAIAELSNVSIEKQFDNLEKPEVYEFASKSLGAWMTTVEARINAGIARRLQRLRTSTMSKSDLDEMRGFLLSQANGNTFARLLLDDRSELNIARPAAIEAATGFIAKKSIADVTGDNLLDISLIPSQAQPGKNPYWKVLGRAFRDYVTMGLEVTPGEYTTPRVQLTPYLGSFTLANDNCKTAEGRYMQHLGNVPYLVLETDGEELSVPEATKPLLIARALRAFLKRDAKPHQFYRLQDNRPVAEAFKSANIPDEVKKQILTGVQFCEVSVSVTVDVGLVNFISKIGKFNTYSYSVLPRENAVSVFSDIARTTEAMVALSNISGGRHVEQSSRGWSLRPVLTTFGDVTRVSREGPQGATDSTQAAADGNTPPVAEGEPPAAAPEIDGDEGMQPVVGWIIDPGARAMGGVNDEEPTLSAESVLAIISVPAWWSEVRLEITRGWLKGSERLSGLKAPDGSVVKFSDEDLSRYNIKLPNRPEFLDTLLIDVVSRQPVIGEVDVIASKETRGGEPCDRVPILVTGPRLWRNTAVTIGSVKATQIEVLPNMEGIIATFKLPVEADTESWSATGKLRVWTSEGVAEYAQDLSVQREGNGCRILIDNSQGTTTPEAEPQTQGDPSGLGGVGQGP